MVCRITRRRTGPFSQDPNMFGDRVFAQDPTTPATSEDKRNWKGFCEIESEPAFFNVMLRRFGVQGAKIQEIVSLDDEILMCLPRPVYGLIFLFKWTGEDPDRQEQSCPEDIWFANQTINNACACVALLNIVNNVPELELGDNLRAFKHFTASFSPALRGDAIGNFEFVREIHNSFARKMDMLNADLLLKKEATSKQKGQKRKTDEEDNEAGFHFIAFMPIEMNLWKLDGLERQPICLGPVEDDWLGQAKPDIETRMAQYGEGQIEFAILSLVKDPLLDLLPALAENVKSVAALLARLDVIKPDWRFSMVASASENINDVLTAAELSLDLTQDQIDRAKLPDNITENLLNNAASEIVASLQELVAAQITLRIEITEEKQAQHSDDERAMARTCDFGAKMQRFARKFIAKEKKL